MGDPEIAIWFRYPSSMHRAITRSRHGAGTKTHRAEHPKTLGSIHQVAVISAQSALTLG
jgi:hypothetical protein